MSVEAILQSLEPTPAGYLRASRALHSAEGLLPVRVSVVSTCNLEPLRPYLAVEAAGRGLGVETRFAAPGQPELALLDPFGPILEPAPDAVVVAARLEELAPSLYGGFVPYSEAELSRICAEVEERMRGLLHLLRRRLSAPVLVFNFVDPEHLDAGTADVLLPISQSALVHRLNERLAALCRAVPGALLFDCARLAREHGLDRWFDSRLWHLAGMPLGAEALGALARRLARALRAALVPPCKCLVLDLDGTLWGGVLGEDGPSGIALGGAYPGSAFREFHRRLLALRARGILLALSSKNDPDAARAALDGHPDGLLRWHHFAAASVGWHDKAAGLRAIAATLEISPAACAFFDDSPVERAWVRSQLPEVMVIEPPDEPLEFWRAIEDSGAFDQFEILEADRLRADSYRANRERDELRRAAVSLPEFLAQLQMRGRTGLMGEETIPRIAQLAARTNQLNLTGRRWIAADLDALARQGALGLWIRVADRFGDYGLVGAVLALPEAPGEWRIDNLLLSCRVLGRGVETALLNALVAHLRERGAATLTGEYLPTGRNQPASDVLGAYGFESDPAGTWRLDLGRAPARATAVEVAGTDA